MNSQEHLLEYYRRELSYLRAQSADFASRYPKVAQRLVLSGGDAADPHTEHLIQSVAFLTARLHRELDRDFPAAAAAILDNLCPSLTRPVPSMTVVQMLLDPNEGKATAGIPVKRGAMLSSTALSGEQCRFQTGWDTTLWPLHVCAVDKEDPRTLRLDLECERGIDVAELALDKLRLHLSGDLLTTMPLHELLISALDHMEILTDNDVVHHLPARHVEEVGFAEQEAMLAQPAHTHPAYCLLQEYFAFPRKFQFFDIGGLRGRLGTGAGFSLRFVFRHGAPVLSLLGADNFLLGCVPVLNLFPVTSEPIAYDRRHYEYLLVADRRRDTYIEVHSVQSVTASDPRGERGIILPSAFADATAGAALCWTTRRETSLRPGIAGTDVYLGFVDRGDVRAELPEPVVYAQLLCTNRQLAQQIVPGTRFYGEGIAASTRIRALYQPSAQRPPAMDTKALWSLVALQRLNHRSLVEGGDALATLREMLGLFGDGARDQVQIAGIRRLTASPGTARIGADTWRGHCRGTDIALEFDRDAFAGNSPLVLAGVLARFFALYTSANSFVRLSVCHAGEPWMRWPAMTGRQCLI